MCESGREMGVVWCDLRTPRNSAYLEYPEPPTASFYPSGPSSSLLRTGYAYAKFASLVGKLRAPNAHSVLLELNALNIITKYSDPGEIYGLFADE